jgi:ferrous iron transport protein B
MKKTVIAFLGQPNSGKSTLFNALTGSHQHVGNWPGKTVEQKEGYFTYGKRDYTVVDLPGSYSLSANSEEEIVTRDYIAGGNADLVCVLADAAQLERSLFMLTDFTGINVPAILLLNMMDVAGQQGKSIDAVKIGERLGIPVIPFVASNTKQYSGFYEAVETAVKNGSTIKTEGLAALYEEIEGYSKIRALIPLNGIDLCSPLWLAAKVLEGDEHIKDEVMEILPEEKRKELAALLGGKGNLLTGDCKFRFIAGILDGAVQRPEKKDAVLSRFDRVVTSNVGGKLIAFFIVVVGLFFAIIPQGIVTELAVMIPVHLTSPVSAFLLGLGVSPFLTELVVGGVFNSLVFALSMAGFVFGITLVFSLLEDIGYMARVSFVFDGVMSKLGLQGKAVMPCFVSLGCTIGGVAGTRVIDTWGQRMLTMAVLWAVPCAAVLSIVPVLAAIFFGRGSAIVMVGIFAVMVFHMMITAKVFGRQLAPEKDRTGMIMELPPYHKPKWGMLFKITALRAADIFWRAFKVIFVVTVVFFCLTYTADGNVANSVIYKIGLFIEPVTRFFGLGWQTFMAFIAAAFAKEAVLGVINALYMGSGGSIFDSAIAKSTEIHENLADVLAASISKPEALAFIFAVSFTVPCVMAMAATYSENRSLKWTLKIAGYYVGVALILSFVIFHLASLIW